MERRRSLWENRECVHPRAGESPEQQHRFQPQAATTSQPLSHVPAAAFQGFPSSISGDCLGGQGSPWSLLILSGLSQGFKYFPPLLSLDRTLLNI